MFTNAETANVRDVNPSPVLTDLPSVDASALPSMPASGELPVPVAPQGILALIDGDNDAWYWYSVNTGHLSTSPYTDNNPVVSVQLPDAVRPQTEGEFARLVGESAEVPADLVDAVTAADPESAPQVVRMLQHIRNLRAEAENFERYDRIGHAMYVIHPSGCTVRADSDGVGIDSDLRRGDADDFTPITSADEALAGWAARLHSTDSIDEAVQMGTHIINQHYAEAGQTPLNDKVIDTFIGRFGPAVARGFPSAEFAEDFNFQPGDTTTTGLNSWTFLGADGARGQWRHNGKRVTDDAWPFSKRWAMGRVEKVAVERDGEEMEVYNPEGTQLLKRAWLEQPTEEQVAEVEKKANRSLEAGRALSNLFGIAEDGAVEVAQALEEEVRAAGHGVDESGMEVVDAEVVDAVNDGTALEQSQLDAPTPSSSGQPERGGIAPAAEDFANPHKQRQNPGGPGGPSSGPQ